MSDKKTDFTAPRTEKNVGQTGSEEGGSGAAPSFGRNRERASSGKGGWDGPGGKRPRGGKTAEDKEHSPKGAAAALIDLDRDIMKLLVRRATLVSRIRGGRDYAASPAAIQAEKAVRIAWETGALSFSKDPRFTRQLFALLQELRVLSKEQAKNLGSFHLSPSPKPVAADITGPTDARTAQMYVALASALGQPLDLESVMLSRTLMDTVKAFAQAGAAVRHHTGASNIGKVSVEPGSSVSFADKTLYLGDDLFTLHLAAFFALGKPGCCRLNGGGGLKNEDITPLRQALPLFGARLAHVVPRSQGLPAVVECSGEIPHLVVVPANLPMEGVCALLLAPLYWNVPVTFNLGELPAADATAALAHVEPVHLALGADIESHGPHFAYTPSELSLPQRPPLPLDPVLSAYLLAFPAFSGGSFTLRGNWPEHLPEAREAEALLGWAGLSLSTGGGVVHAASGRQPFALPLQCNDLSPQLGPLFLTLYALFRHKVEQVPPLQRLGLFPSEEADMSLAGDFFARLGLSLEDGRLEPALGADAAALPSWTSPDAFWSMAYALAAYLKPGISLANPGNISPAMPPFWSIYNALPTPPDPAAAPERTETKEHDGDKPTRRRILTD